MELEADQLHQQLDSARNVQACPDICCIHSLRTLNVDDVEMRRVSLRAQFPRGADLGARCQIGLDEWETIDGWTGSSG